MSAPPPAYIPSSYTTGCYVSTMVSSLSPTYTASNASALPVPASQNDDHSSNASTVHSAAAAGFHASACR